METLVISAGDSMTISQNFWKDRRVLITGHTGFKGCWLTLLLLSLGAKVWGYSLAPKDEPNLFNGLQLSKDTSNLKNDQMHHKIGNICDIDALFNYINESSPEIVFHLAAQPLVRESYSDPLLTWNTNVIGSLKLLECLKSINHCCAVVMVSTDKVYENHEWVYGYRELDRLGGHDPYSSSKSAMELGVSSWRSSFCGPGDNQTPYLAISTARAGNVIGGGDYSQDRIVPDAIRSLQSGVPIPVRNPYSTRPWQHVLEPLSGYISLAQSLLEEQEINPNQTNSFTQAFNFGPTIQSNQPVGKLIEELLLYWPGKWSDVSDPSALHEAGLLNLVSDMARNKIGWEPKWNFKTTVFRTINWYKKVNEGKSPMSCCMDDINNYFESNVIENN